MQEGRKRSHAPVPVRESVEIRSRGGRCFILDVDGGEEAEI